MLKSALAWRCIAMRLVLMMSLVAGLLTYPSYARADMGWYVSGAQRSRMQSSVIGWQIETVDNTGDVGAYCSLALDTSGYAHVAYYDATQGGIKVAYQDASGWHCALVDVARQAQGVYAAAAGISLALDGQDRAHIAYHSEASQGYHLEYAWQDEAGWHFETLPEPTVGPQAALAIDHTDGVHIAYWTGEAHWRFLKYASRSESGWSAERVLNRDTGILVSLALDAQGTPHIGSCDISLGDLLYAHRDAGWQIETPDRKAGVEWDSAIATDIAGWPYMAYAAQDGTDLRYAYRNADGWHLVPVQGVTDVGSPFSLSLDSTRYAHLSCYAPQSGDLKYVWQDKSGWHSLVVDSEESVGSFNALARDATGRVLIAYYDATHGDLKFAAGSGPWLIWRDVGGLLPLSTSGLHVEVLYSAVRAPDTLVARLNGAATFTDGSQEKSVLLKFSSGNCVLALLPAPGAALGESFSLAVEIGTRRLERDGVIARALYLPTLRR